ncbi:TlpA family protein disulfide reductase [Myxococcota bacterium]|nr:TlpA family protein disulfide reductase [Myxococcota bacterium]MBU1537847.1 TlpA family protein disulfide reductase [Myxococcota bacterium]
MFNYLILALVVLSTSCSGTAKNHSSTSGSSGRGQAGKTDSTTRDTTSSRRASESMTTQSAHSAGPAHVVPAVEPAAEASKSGVSLPSFAIPSLWGNTCTNSDYKGKPAIVEVWSAGCPHCVNQAEELEKLAKSLDFSKFAVIAIHATGGKSVKKSVASHFTNKKIQVCLDNMSFVRSLKTLAYKYRVRGVPHLFILDKKGNIQVVLRGTKKAKFLKKVLKTYE